MIPPVETEAHCRGGKHRKQATMLTILDRARISPLQSSWQQPGVIILMSQSQPRVFICLPLSEVIMCIFNLDLVVCALVVVLMVTMVASWEQWWFWCWLRWQCWCWHRFWSQVWDPRQRENAAGALVSLVGHWCAEVSLVVLWCSGENGALVRGVRVQEFPAIPPPLHLTIPPITSSDFTNGGPNSNDYFW